MSSWQQYAKDLETSYLASKKPRKIPPLVLADKTELDEGLVEPGWLADWLDDARRNMERIFFPDHKLRIDWDSAYKVYASRKPFKRRSLDSLEPLFVVIESAWRELQADDSLATLQNQVRREVLEKFLGEVESICRQQPHVAGMVAMGCLLNVYDGLFKVNVANGKLQKMRQLYAEMVARHPFANPAETIDVIDLLADVRKAFGLGANA